MDYLFYLFQFNDKQSIKHNNLKQNINTRNKMLK